MEYKLFEGDVPFVSTAEFHRDRERAPHLEQSAHVARLYAAAEFVRKVGKGLTVSDLGCGDGGLLSLIMGDVHFAWGYDFQPSNAEGWAQRGVNASQLDVFNGDWDEVAFGNVVIMTEVLEHLADPHGILRRLHAEQNVNHIVASSPRNETPESHSPEHAWAWDPAGYAKLFEDTGWHVTQHAIPDHYFQVILAERQ
jgi:2-polyprenyl-3-methyl-5-hydroxy-6-metoxy-1,4-benzoquinol methylase